jgi:Ran GTPase-activating protein (RanGAP) involved in mRNA processing and transport
MSSMNLLQNGISIDQALVLASILKTHAILKSLCGNNGDETELDMSGMDISAAEATMLASEIAGNGALSVLSLKNNQLATAEAGHALGKALQGNTVLKELDLSNNSWDDRFTGTKVDGAGFAQGLSKGLSDNGALLVLSLRDNSLATKEGGKALARALASNSTLKELDVSDNWRGGDGPGFAEELAVGIKDNGALSSLNLSSNRLAWGGDMSGNMLKLPV